MNGLKVYGIQTGVYPVHSRLDQDNEFISYVIQKVSYLKLYCFTSGLQPENQLIFDIVLKIIYSYQNDIKKY